MDDFESHGESESGLNQDATFQFVGLWPRFLALLIDLVLFCLIFFPITRVVKGTWLMDSGDHSWVSGWFITDPICVSFLAVMLLYYVVLEGIYGMTAGKRTMRIRVADMDGNRPGLLKSLVRNVLRLVDGLPAFNILGVVLIVKTVDRTRVGDLVAGTRVIRVNV